MMCLVIECSTTHRHGARVYGAAPCHPTLSAEEIRDVNTRYHDVAADHYDHKWGIDFGELGHDQVLAKVRKALHGRRAGFRSIPGRWRSARGRATSR